MRHRWRAPAEDTLKKYPDVDRRARPDNTDCLVAFQQGTVDAIVSDDDRSSPGSPPRTPTPGSSATPSREEPYGARHRARRTSSSTRFVNGVLEDVRRRPWAGSYDRWLAATLGPAPPPPAGLRPVSRDVSGASRRPGPRAGWAWPSPAELLAYLDGLRRWRDGRRAELDQLDRAALAAAEPDALTGDLTLAMALWQAVSDRV